MKKIFLSIAVLGCATTVFANGSTPATAEPNYFDGFYIGAGADMQHTTGDVKNDTKQGVSTSRINLSRSIDYDIGETDFGGDINLGYGKTFKIQYSKYYAGIELYTRYAYDNPTINNNNSYSISGYTIDNLVTQINIKNDFSYGTALKLGYLITPKSMFYILAGMEYTKFDIDETHTNVVNTDQFPSNNYSFSRNEFAFVPGVGLETMLGDNISLKAQYTYAMYPSFSHSNENSVNVENITIVSTANDKFDLSRGIFSLGLTYHFNNI